MKNNLWFKHDYGARNDPKLKRLVSCKGPGAGYIWWVIVEMLNEEGGKLPRDYYDLIAYDTHSDVETVKFVVEESGLFQFDKKVFWSARQQRDQEEAEKIKEKNRKGGIKSGESRRLNRSTLQQETKYTSSGLQDHLNDDGSTPELYKQTHTQTNTQTKIDADASSGASEMELFPDVPKKGKYDDAKLVFDMWNEMNKKNPGYFPSLSSFDSRKESIRETLGRFKEVGEPIEIARELIQKAFSSELFRTSSWGNFDWIFCTKGKNWSKLRDGNYDDRPNNGNGFDRLHITATSPEDYEGDF